VELITGVSLKRLLIQLRENKNNDLRQYLKKEDGKDFTVADAAPETPGREVGLAASLPGIDPVD
jgi:hypothetical protein